MLIFFFIDILHRNSIDSTLICELKVFSSFYSIFKGCQRLHILSAFYLALFGFLSIFVNLVFKKPPVKCIV